MDISTAARVIDLFSFSFVFGATAWFFFIQSPVLLKMLKRERFVPIQMRLTVALFKALTAATFVAFLASLVHSGSSSLTTIAVGAAFFAVLINKFVVLPRALKAGGQGRSEIKGKDSEGSTAGFVSDGVGNKTKVMHRLVVLFVVMMLGGMAVHGVLLVGDEKGNPAQTCRASLGGIFCGGLRFDSKNQARLGQSEVSHVSDMERIRPICFCPHVCRVNGMRQGRALSGCDP